MTNTPKTVPTVPVAAAMRAVRGDLMAANPQQLARVVAMVDALPDRGAADALIEPLRPRLSTLGVSRPLSFSRLLFIPLDPVLLHAAQWRRGAVGVPRTIIGPLTQTVREGWRGAAALERQLASHRADDHAMVLQAGTGFWPEAAKILSTAVPDAEWTARTGLHPADFGPLCRVVVSALELGPALYQTFLARDAEAGRIDARTLVAAMLRLPAAGRAETLATLIAMLLVRLPRPGEVLTALEKETPPIALPLISRARSQALEFVLGRLQTPPPTGGDAEEAADDVLRRALVLEQMIAWAQYTPHRGEVEETRRNADAVCRKHFEVLLEDTLLVPTTPEPAALHAAVIALEDGARNLRRFEQAARHIGGAEFYDRRLREAATRLTAPNAGTLTLPDRVRLTELLLGPDAAMALLESAKASSKAR